MFKLLNRQFKVFESFIYFYMGKKGRNLNDVTMPSEKFYFNFVYYPKNISKLWVQILNRFQMIILLYLAVISGWALLILLIKCRKAREKRIAMEQQQGTKKLLLKISL